MTLLFMIKKMNILEKFTILIVLIIANLTVISCTSQKTLTCRQIKNIITDLNSKIEPALASDNVLEIKAIAQEFEMTREKLLQVEINDNFLSQSTKNLASTYQEYGEVTYDFLQAFTTKNTENAIASKQAVNQLFTKQQQLVGEINDYCYPP
ncbi:hypothetical protein VKI21_05465 [Cyanobacterium aponinum UTEX 3222]|uniref:hypothetical protein n=1 Tax=Cyanobacterium aponinum TaxID=379064 RepID=UPI000C130F30|nr:hypothetical protein [Cyanobacterium aponinum]PHV62452.1 hypothetical protein CSQ80_10060 [Cyanobacterium aponinum IPPAS B-1201]WRL43134.1 hypothetical protein VKI21_05465 [Cyanobacterium aponinum UTEX 3222]